MWASRSCLLCCSQLHRCPLPREHAGGGQVGPDLSPGQLLPAPSPSPGLGGIWGRRETRPQQGSGAHTCPPRPTCYLARELQGPGSSTWRPRHVHVRPSCVPPAFKGCCNVCRDLPCYDATPTAVRLPPPWLMVQTRCWMAFGHRKESPVRTKYRAAGAVLGTGQSPEMLLWSQKRPLVHGVCRHGGRGT